MTSTSMLASRVTDTQATPAVMRAAAATYDRARRLKLVGFATLGGGAVAVAAAAAGAGVAFLIGRSLRRR